MSVAQEATEIERHTAHLSDVDGEPPYTIHGIAIGEGDVTRGSSGIEKKWPREALKPAAETLAGRPLVVDHENDSHAVVGKVTEAFYKEGTGVLYEAELFDEELAEKIANGLLEVSIRGFHGDVSEMDESEEGAKVVQELRFDNLSIVPMGAAPSNTVEIGPADEMDGDELTGERCAALIESAELSHAAPDEDEVEQAADAPDWSEGRVVQWQVNPEMMGKIVHVDEEKSILMVEVMEEEDGEMKSSGFTITAGYGDVLPVDEEELAGDPHEGAEFERQTDTDRYSKDISRYPEGDNTPPEDSEGMHEDDDEETSFENKEGDSMEDVEELAVSMHEPEFDEAKDKEWNKPSLSEFLSAMDADAEGWDDLSEEQQSMIADHFLVSKTEEWPPENYGDLALPVVEPDGTLNLNALQNAKARAGQVEGVSSDEEESIGEMIDSLANENFDATFGDEEENHAIDVVRETRTAFEFGDGRILSVADDEVEELRAAEEQTGGTEEEENTSNDDARDNEEAEAEAGEGSEPDSNASTSSEQGDSNMTETVEIDKDELENLRAQAEKADEREEELEELREGFSEDLAELKDRTAVLEDADRELVEELTDADDPIVVESERFEELERHVDEVRDAYADALASHVGMDEETLSEKFSVDELRGQLEEQIDEDAEVEEELTPDPKSEDPESEEELEEASGEADEEEELAEEAKDKQEELRAKMGLN